MPRSRCPDVGWYKLANLVANNFCWSHCQIEVFTETSLRMCGECWHVFQSEQELIDAYNDNAPKEPLLAPGDTEPTPPPEPVTSVDQIFFCPHCIHDW